jgi:ATP-dependent Lon protease
VSGDGTVGLYRVEVSQSSGTGKLKLAGRVSGTMKESVSRAFSYLQANKTPFGVGAGARHLRPPRRGHRPARQPRRGRARRRLLRRRVLSMLRKAQPQAGLLVLGDMSVQGNIKPRRSLTEPLQVAMDNGAKRVLVPIENKRQVLEVNADVLEAVDPIFYGDVRQAAFKALGVDLGHD